MSANKRPTRSKLALSTSIVAVGATVLALAGCGGSSSSSSTQAAAGPTQTARHTASQSNADVGTAQAQRPISRPSRATRQTSGTSTRSRWAVRQRPQARSAPPTRFTRRDPTRIPRSTRTRQLKAANPCKLVSRSEAQTIIGRTVSASIEAPLGPTCIYQLAGSKSEITLQVENVKLQPDQPPADKAQPG